MVKSTLAAETLALVDGLDTAIYLGHILSELLGKTTKNIISVECFIDNKSLFDNIHSTKLVSEKRLRIDIAVIKQMLERKEIDSVTWVDASHQLSDCLTKRGASCEKLLQVFKTGSLLL